MKNILILFLIPIIISLKSPEFSLNQCDFLTNGPICINNGDKIILPNNFSPNLKAYYSFDQKIAIDETGNGYNLNGNLLSGSSLLGNGVSFLNKNGNYLYNNNIDFLNNNNEFSITFYIFLIDDYNNNNEDENVYCPFISTNNNDNNDNNINILYDINDKHLKLNIFNNELISYSRLLTQRWYHISITFSSNNLHLYINGIPDKHIEISNNNDKNTNNNNKNKKVNFYIGNYNKNSNCNFPYLLDELKLYNIQLKKEYIQSESSFLLGGIENNFIRIGCIDCSIDEAEKSCEKNYKICSSLELHTGGYQIARNLGLLNWDTHIWTRSALKEKSNYEGLTGLGMCCAQIK